MKKLMIYMDQLQEYTTPRYFYILPAKDYNLDILDSDQHLFRLHFKLYFLCDCLNDPEKFHTVQYEGYSIRNLKEFIAKYGQYLQITLNFVPLLISSKEQIRNTTTVSSNYTDNMKYKLKFAQNFLYHPDVKRMYTDFLSNGKTSSQLDPIQAVDFEELENYLIRNDPTVFLSNLYRIMTGDGQIRWICQKDYDLVSYNKGNNAFIKQIETIGGKYYQAVQQLSFNRLKLTNANVKLIIQILKKGCVISKFLFYQCLINENDFDMLIDVMINYSSIQCIEIDNLNILNYFGFTKYTCKWMKISFTNSLLTVDFNGSFQDETKYLFIRILKQNKIYRTLQISANDFRTSQQQLQECLNANIRLDRFIVNNTGNIDMFDSIFKSTNQRIRYLKLNDPLSLFNNLKSNYSANLSLVDDHFCSLIKSNETLVELDIMNSSGLFDIRVLRNIFDVLERHKSIKQFRLHISSMKYYDGKEPLLMNFLTDYPFLTHLRLSESNLSDQLIQNLVVNIQKYHSLVYLEFKQCEFNENSIERLKQLEDNGVLFNFIYPKPPPPSTQTSPPLKRTISKSSDVGNRQGERNSSAIGWIILILICILVYKFY